MDDHLELLAGYVSLLVRPKFSTQSSFVAVALVLGVVVFFLLRRGLRGDLPSATEKAEQIGRLEATVLPVIEELQIAYFMDEPDCANLTYPRGDFIDGDPELCGGSTDSQSSSTMSPALTTTGSRPRWRRPGLPSSASAAG